MLQKFEFQVFTQFLQILNFFNVVRNFRIFFIPIKNSRLNYKGGMQRFSKNLSQSLRALNFCVSEASNPYQCRFNNDFFQNVIPLSLLNSSTKLLVDLSSLIRISSPISIKTHLVTRSPPATSNIARYVSSIAQHISRISQYINSIAQYISSIAQYVCSIAQYISSIVQYISSIAQYICSIAQYICSVTQYVSSIAQYISSIAQFISSIAQYIEFCTVHKQNCTVYKQYCLFPYAFVS